MSTSTKDRILEATIDLFAQRGYAAVSIREITRAVGIKESSLYNHFQNKEELLETILAMFRREFQSIIPPTESLDALLAQMEPGQFLRTGFLRYREQLSSPLIGKLWQFICIEQYRDPRARDLVLKYVLHGSLHFLENVFSRLSATRRIKPLDPSMLAAEYGYPLFAMLTEYKLLLLDGRETAELERRMEEHITFFLAAVTL
jgi:AcrR family transcriptional regulator